MTVATALIASQAVLCAVIGWVTFGSKEPAHSQPRAAEPLLGPPIVVPPASVAPVTTPPALGPVKPDRTTGSLPKQSLAPIRSSAAAQARRAEPTLAPAPSTSARIGADLVHPATPSASAVQTGAEVGEKCDPEDADGVTTDGIAVRCLPDEDGNLVWQII